MLRIEKSWTIAGIILFSSAVIFGGVYSGGNGSAHNPYQIATVDDFIEMSNTPTDWDKVFLLMNDIDLDGLVFDRSPIAPDLSTDSGHQGTNFSGIFDGDGYVIRNLTIQASGDSIDYVSLFGRVSNTGQIKNLGIESLNIEGYNFVGGIIGWADGIVMNCYSTGEVYGNQWVGGIVGTNPGMITESYSYCFVLGTNRLGGVAGSGPGIISNSYSSGNVEGLGDFVGGIIGWNNGTVINCYSISDVSGNSRVGGLAGYQWDATIQNSYSSGAVSGNSWVGGLIGRNHGALVSDSYSLSSVIGLDRVGGLCGLNSEDGIITNCYSTGAVSGVTSVGGLVGYNYSTIQATSSFWDTDTSGQSSSEGGTGKTTAEMKTQSTFTEAGWDFTDIPIWKMTSQINYFYPSLAWQEPPLFDKEIIILSPNGGEIYTVGTTKAITWQSEGDIVNVQLLYSSDYGSTWSVIKTVANTGSTTWTIPNTPSPGCLIKTSDADNADIFDISDAVFTIQSAYPVLTYPNGGQQFYTGTSRNIYWNTVGLISNISIEYSADNGSSWTEVKPPNVGNSSPHSWTIPYDVSDQCLIRVSDAENPSSHDVSNAPFSILASRPNLWMPNGGENLLTGSDYDIRWSTTGVIENIDIQYSTDNGTTWQPVSPANTGNTGNYTWAVPYEASDHCLVRISDVDNPEVYDLSESTFQIVSSLPKLLSPSGGERLLSGSTVLIEWETTGVISDILIEYSLDNGTTWTESSPPNVGNTGSYDWTVPYEMSQECLVRVSDLSHPVVHDVSENVFQISPLYLNAPQGGQKILINSLYPIRWVSGETFAEDLISIQYSVDNGQGWIDLGEVENNGVYHWAVPEMESNQYLVYITLANNPDIYDMSKDTFVVYQCYEQIPGDLDGDCMVGLSDFAIIAENWMNRGKVLIRDYPLDENPNWMTEGEWEFGQPLGLGGTSYGYPDPNSGYTGVNVYGINLDGDYDTAVGGPYYLTTPPIACRHFDSVKVSFMSWLNIDGSNFAYCSFEVSANGTDWVILWSNTLNPITDNEWNKMEFDISEFADDNPTLYLRWGYQIFDRVYPYSGWNIDDIELWGTL